jgi:hypothetical protein
MSCWLRFRPRCSRHVGATVCVQVYFLKLKLFSYFCIFEWPAFGKTTRKRLDGGPFKAAKIICTIQCPLYTEKKRAQNHIKLPIFDHCNFPNCWLGRTYISGRRFSPTSYRKQGRYLVRNVELLCFVPVVRVWMASFSFPDCRKAVRFVGTRQYGDKCYTCQTHFPPWRARFSYCVFPEALWDQRSKAMTVCN